MYSFPILNQFVVPCLVLTVASWPAYRFLRRQVRWSGILISLSIFNSLLLPTQTLESPLDCKEIQLVHSEGDQPWDFFGGNDAEAETPVLWTPHAKSWLIGKDSDAGRDWGQEEAGTTEDDMAGWHHWLDGHESDWTPGVCDGQGGLACCNSWGRKESDMTEWLNWTDLTIHQKSFLNKEIGRLGFQVIRKPSDFIFSILAKLFLKIR